MPSTAVIFDLDGTLIDSLTDIAAAMNRCLADIGAPQRTVAEYGRFIGEGTLRTTAKAAPEDADVPAIAAAFSALYTAEYVPHTRLFDGISEAVVALKAAGVILGVLSNKPHPATVAIVERLFAPGTFAAVAGVKPGVPKKPDPTAALAQAALFGVPPQRTFFVGDTAIDIGTGLSAGMRPVGVSWGFRPPEELRAAGADLICTSPAQLVDLATL